MSKKETKTKKPFYKRGWFIGIVALSVKLLPNI